LQNKDEFILLPHLRGSDFSRFQAASREAAISRAIYRVDKRRKNSKGVLTSF